MNMHVPALPPSLRDVIAEYDQKSAAMTEAVRAFEKAGLAIKSAATVAGVFGDVTIDTGHVYERDLRLCLLKSAWKHTFQRLQIDRLASPADKQRFEQSMASPPPFTFDNVLATFGDFVKDPLGNILRGLAEVFCDLDQAYKSHDKVKVGVAGLPKRIILGGVSTYGWGKDRIESVLNALAAYQGKPLITWRELYTLIETDGDALLASGELPGCRTWPKPEHHCGRGVRLVRFKNGNGHLIFEPGTLRDINKALAAFYGDVLPDTTNEKPTAKQASTAVSKDLQFYGTPPRTVAHVMHDVNIKPGQTVLEPSCGEGAFMIALRKAGAKVDGVEVNHARAERCRALGFPVLTANFLETTPTRVYDQVVMNPPFYGKHYEKHVRHALRFLKPGGTLTAILPITARYDHGLLNDLGGRWSDLPVGSFSESGTNINTTVLTVHAPRT